MAIAQPVARTPPTSQMAEPSSAAAALAETSVAEAVAALEVFALQTAAARRGTAAAAVAAAERRAQTSAVATPPAVQVVPYPADRQLRMTWRHSIPAGCR